MNITITANKTPEGGVNVSWELTFEKVPRYVGVTVFWSKKPTTAVKGATGAYAYDSRQGFPIQLAGSITVFPPPGTSPAWAMVVGTIAQQEEGAPYDQYESAEPVQTTPIKL